MEKLKGPRVRRHKKILHNPNPDYSRPTLAIPKPSREKIRNRLVFLYGREAAEKIMPELERIMKIFYAFKPSKMIEGEKHYNPTERFTEKDIILITYGDLLRDDGRSPLSTLAEFCDTYLEGNINTLHLLPFFPYSSDHGFSIIDFETVDPHIGSWRDIEKLGTRYKLMFDGVVNHASSKNRWFQEFLNGNPFVQRFFYRLQITK